MDNIFASLIVGYVLAWLYVFADSLQKGGPSNAAGAALFATIVAPFVVGMFYLIFATITGILWAFGEVFG